MSDFDVAKANSAFIKETLASDFFRNENRIWQTDRYGVNPSHS
jgi:hypothetical protein